MQIFLTITAFVAMFLVWNMWGTVKKMRLLKQRTVDLSPLAA